MTTHAPRQRLKISLPPELRRWIHDEAARRRCSFGQVLRDLIVAEMERRDRLEATR